jgi:hypothetical protein
LNQEYDSGQKEPKSPVGIIIAGACLVMGVVGVFLVGPSNVVTGVTGLLRTEKVAEPEPALEPFEEERREPVRKPVQPKPEVKVARVEPPPPPVEIKPAPLPRPRTFAVRIGMPRRELLDTYGAPAMKATKIENGHLVENYAYMAASRVQQTVVLMDGQVIQATGN